MNQLQYYGIKRNVPFTNRTGCTMNVNFEATDTTRAILSVHKGCGNGSMIVFTPDGRGKIINDKSCAEHVQQIMGTTHDSILCVTEEPTYWTLTSMMESMTKGDKFENDSGISFPVITERILGENFEPSTGRSLEEANNSSGRPW